MEWVRSLDQLGVTGRLVRSPFEGLALLREVLVEGTECGGSSCGGSLVDVLEQPGLEDLAISLSSAGRMIDSERARADLVSARVLWKTSSASVRRSSISDVSLPKASDRVASVRMTTTLGWEPNTRRGS